MYFTNETLLHAGWTDKNQHTRDSPWSAKAGTEQQEQIWNLQQLNYQIHRGCNHQLSPCFRGMQEPVVPVNKETTKVLFYYTEVFLHK